MERKCISCFLKQLHIVSQTVFHIPHLSQALKPGHVIENPVQKAHGLHQLCHLWNGSPRPDQDDRPQVQRPQHLKTYLSCLERSVFLAHFSLCVCVPVYVSVSVEWTSPFSVSQTPIGFVLNKLSALCTLKEVHLLWRVLSSLQAACEMRAYCKVHHWWVCRDFHFLSGTFFLSRSTQALWHV